MKKKIFFYVWKGVIGTILCGVIFTVFVLHGHLITVEQDRLNTIGELIKAGIEKEGIDYLENLNTYDYEVTYYEAIGEYTASEADVNREVVKDEKHTLYYLTEMEDGSLLQVAVTRISFTSLLFQMITPLLWLLIACTVLSLLITKYVTSSIMRKG